MVNPDLVTTSQAFNFLKELQKAILRLYPQLPDQAETILSIQNHVGPQIQQMIDSLNTSQTSGAYQNAPSFGGFDDSKQPSGIQNDNLKMAQ